MPKRRSIKTSSPSDFEPKRKNPISLGSDSNMDNDLKPLKIGGKTTPLKISNDTIEVGSTLLYNGKEVLTSTLTTEEVQDIVGAMFTSNTETRVAATYQDSDGTIDLAVDDMTANDNTQNTTTLSFVDSSDDIILRNTTGGAGSGTDDIKFVAGSNITLTHTDADNITIASSGGGGGASALNDLSDVTYSSGDLTISSLDKIISGSLDFDSSGHINFDGCAAGFTRTTYADATNVTVDFRTGNKAHLDMTGGSISGTLTMQFPAVSGNFVLVVQQDGSTRTINAYATKDSAGNAGSNDGGSAGAVRWSGGSVPDLTDGGNKRDILSFYWDATEEVCYGVASLNF